MSVKLRSKKLSDGSESLYLDKYIHGKRDYEFLGIKINKNDPLRKHKKIQAETIRAKRELESIANYHDIPKSFNGDEDFIEFYKSQSIDSAFKSSLNAFTKFSKNKMVNERLPFKLITEKLIEEYKTYLLKEYKNSTGWMYLVKLKTILYKAVRQKIILTNPGKHISIKLNEIEKIYLTLDELKILDNTECHNNEIKKAFLFSCWTGLRMSDVIKLTWKEIQDNKINFRQKKTKRLEYLTIGETAIKYLYQNVNRDEINLDDKVFKLGEGKAINRNLRKWVETTSITKYVTFHTARHTFAVLCLSQRD